MRSPVLFELIQAISTVKFSMNPARVKRFTRVFVMEHALSLNALSRHG